MTIGTSDGQQFDSEFDMHVARQSGYNSQTSYQRPDYDYEGAQKAGIKPDPQSGHWPDTYKLPNHITFSDESKYHGQEGNEGGHWSQLEGDRWSFTPGATNFQHHSLKEMQDYFKKYETGNVLNAEANLEPKNLGAQSGSATYEEPFKNPNNPWYNPTNIEGPPSSFHGHQYVPNFNLGGWNRVAAANNPAFNTPKVIKDQSRVPPTMAPGAPQLPAGEFNQPIRYPGTFEKDSIDRTHDVPLAASAIIDKEGNPTGHVAIDKDIPPHPEFDQFVHMHEMAEATHMKNLIDAGQDPVEAYREAHDRIATPIETAAVRAHAVRTGRNPDQYLDEYKAHWREGASIAAEGPFDNINPDAHTTRYGLDKAELGKLALGNEPIAPPLVPSEHPDADVIKDILLGPGRIIPKKGKQVGDDKLAMNLTPPDDPWTEAEKMAGVRFGHGVAGPGKASPISNIERLPRQPSNENVDPGYEGYPHATINDAQYLKEKWEEEQLGKMTKEQADALIKANPDLVKYAKEQNVQKRRKEFKVIEGDGQTYKAAADQLREWFGLKDK